MGKVFVISDTLFYDSAKLLDRKRPFKSIGEAHVYITDMIHSEVSENDILFFLGDISRGNSENTRLIMNSLKVRKRLVWGEKDKSFGEDFWTKKCGFEAVHDSPLWLKGDIVLSHRRISEDFTGFKLNFYGHEFPTVGDDPRFVNATADVNYFTPLYVGEEEDLL